MRERMRVTVPVLMLALVLAACGGGTAALPQEEQVQERPAPAATEASEPVAQPSPTGEPTEVAVISEPTATEAAGTEAEGSATVEEEATAVSVPEATATPEPTATMFPTATSEPTAVAANLPVYLSSELVNVNSGESFRIADLTAQGNYVLLETMAVWCTNCRHQQEQIKAYEATGPANVVSVALDIDLNESEALLREHATRNGFDWYYAIATPEVARQLGLDFGQQFLTPPSVPMLLVRPDNSVVTLPFGIKSAEELAVFVEGNRLE